MREVKLQRFREQEKKTKRSHALPVELSLANTFQAMCVCVCVCLVGDLGNYGMCGCGIVMSNISEAVMQKHRLSHHIFLTAAFIFYIKF